MKEGRETANRVRCGLCGEFFQPRNFNRHRKACLRRARKTREKAEKAWRKEHRS